MERKVIQVFSHNVVLVKLPSGNNSIVMGKGIGFKKSPGDLVDPSGITQEFLLHRIGNIPQKRSSVKRPS